MSRHRLLGTLIISFSTWHICENNMFFCRMGGSSGKWEANGAVLRTLE